MNKLSRTKPYIPKEDHKEILDRIADILNTEFRVPQYFSDYYVQKAWFVRVDNINIGYSFGRILKNKIGLRVFATIQNAFLITKYKGVDPEIFNGIDNNLYPRPRIFSLGVNIQI